MRASKSISQVGHDAPEQDLFGQAIQIRCLEERLLELFSQGELHGTVHTCLGQEWIGVAISRFLQPIDYVFSNHRCHGHYLARTDDVEGLIAEVMGKSTGVCGGRGGSQHLCRDGFFSNGIQGGIVPVAAGLALAQQIRRTNGIAVVFLGDGTLGEGAVYETLNFASVWRIPLLFVVENNGYSQSTRQQETLAGTISARAAAFDIGVRRASTWDVDGLLQESERAIADVRATGKPTFFVIDTDRLGAHSKGDDLRDRDELEIANARDPIRQFASHSPEEYATYVFAAQRRIEQAVEAARLAPSATMTPLKPSGGQPGRDSAVWKPVVTGNPERVVEKIRDALERALAFDERVILLGEDIESPYGGAFKVTKGLSEKFPGRVCNMPISEALIVGVGNGLALAGLRPVCEIMFADFLTLAADQLINHAAKFESMYNGQVQVPLLVRTPTGGRRGYGPTHSQSLEKLFLGMTGSRIVAVNHRLCPGLLYDSIFAHCDRPTLVLENKVLYGQFVPAPNHAGFVVEQCDLAFPTIRIRPEGPADVTLVCYGEMLREAEQSLVLAFDEWEIICEIIAPSQISPLDIGPILESVRKTGRLVTVEEGEGTAGFGAEVMASVMEQIDRPVQFRRVAGPVCPIPASHEAEKSLLPDAGMILTMIREVVGHG